MPLDPHARSSPVDWLEWGPRAFDRARREEKPILLRISAVWCHWCHVMDEKTDADPEVARRMNEWFVPVRVDNDERPDVNDRYNLGGWPTTAFLTPEGELITGGTYFPAPQMREILERIHEGWSQHREELDAEVERIRRRRRESLEKRVPGDAAGRVTGEAIADLVEAALDTYDWRHGGFGTQPKFPQPEAVRLLLHAHAGSEADGPREAAEKTLIRMRTAGEAEGRTYGLYDHAAGGFFRYSTTRDWTEPHFEKMCEDNARLALAYLDGWRLFGEELYEGTVRGIFDFVLRTLSDPDGGAYGSQDADGEAAYYGKPLAERAEMETPFIDRRFYASWNGMMVVAALQAGAALGWPELDDWARRTLERLDPELATDAGGVRRVLRPQDDERVDDEAPLLLGDQAWWLRAVLAAYQATGDPAWRDRAVALVRFVERELFDVERGAARDRASGGAEGGLSDPHWPLADNVALAEGLIAHAALGGGERWRERAAGILAATREEALRQGVHGAGWGLAAAQVVSDPIRVHLVGSTEAPELRGLRTEAGRAWLPGGVTEILDPSRDGERLASLGYPTDGPPRAYVCIGDRCLEPASGREELVERIAEALAARS
ncbi:MAG: DUF255 domain-containing protein [Gemmatimonadetes bacterium]|nr:DUF255 domain-containing protein [Gemmatimonadota bacterium]